MLSPRESAAPGLKKGGAPEEVEDKTKHRGKQRKIDRNTHFLPSNYCCSSVKY